METAETDELGNRTWRHEGWTITSWSDGQVHVDAPEPVGKRVEVYAGPSYVSVMGEREYSGYEPPHPAAVEMPHEVMAELLRMVGYEVSRRSV